MSDTYIVKETDKEIDYLAPFKFLGLTFGKASDGINFPTTCPFSEKENKLYVNQKTGQWNSFTSNKHGNVLTFMREYYALCLEHTTIEDLMLAVENRKLPLQAIQGFIAYNPLSDKYLIPTKDLEGNICNVTSWHPNYKTPLKMPNVPVSLIGLEKLKGNDKTIYLCEGEWDVIALTWFFKATQRIDAVVIGVPGANTFKDVWIPYFNKREAYVIFDNDKAGYDGQQRVADKIRSVVSKVQFLLFPELTKTKYDIRDMIIELGMYPNYNIQDLKKLSDIIDNLCQNLTQHEKDSGVSEFKPKFVVDTVIPTRIELETMFMKHLKLKTTKDIAIIFSTCFANMLKGDPVWLFLIAPPGGTKTEFLMTLSKSPYIETVSTLTPAALVPGIRLGDGRPDPSLFKKVHNRMLIVKDMTTMLSMNPVARDEIFGLLRDAYDGYVEKWFATHKKSYVTHFGCIAGVTPAIDAYNSIMTTMGARFIYWRIGTTETPDDHREKIRKAMSNVNEEDFIREELRDISYRFLERGIPEELPIISDIDKDKIISMSMFTASLRASIIKDKYSNEQLAPVFKEVGTRLAKVYLKMAYGLCYYYDKTEVDEEILTILREVCLDTCPSIILNIVLKIQSECRLSEDNTARLAVVDKTLSVGRSTIYRIIQDLELQKVIVLVSGGGADRMPVKYRLSDEIQSLMATSGISSSIPFAEKKLHWVGKSKKIDAVV